MLRFATAEEAEGGGVLLRPTHTFSHDDALQGKTNFPMQFTRKEFSGGTVSKALCGAETERCAEFGNL